MHFMNHLWTVPTTTGLRVGCHCAGMLPKSRLTKVRASSSHCAFVINQKVEYKEEVTENLICFRLKPSLLFWDYVFKMTLVGRAAFPVPPCMVRPPKMTVPSLSVHPCSTRACFTFTLLTTDPPMFSPQDPANGCLSFILLYFLATWHAGP